MAEEVNEVDISGALADSPDASAEALELLVRSPDPAVRRYVASHPDVSTALLRSLSADDNYEVRAAVAGSANSSQDLLDALLADRDLDVRIAALRTGRASDAALAAQIVKERQHRMGNAIRKAPVSAAVVLAAASSEHVRIRRGVAARKGLAEPAIRALHAAGYDKEVYLRIARQGALPPDLALVLAACDHPEIAMAAAASPAYSTAVSTTGRNRLTLAAVALVLVLAAVGGAGIVGVGGLIAAQVMRTL